MRAVYVCAAVVQLVFVSPVQPQTTSEASDQAPKLFSSSEWCKDALTLCFSTSSRDRTSLSGIRLVFEPQVGIIFQNGENRFQNTSFKALERIGLETNLFKGLVAAQFLVIYPSTVEFDEKSPIADFIRDESRRVGVDFGMSAGFSFFDGILATGAGFLDYDQRDLLDVAQNGTPRPDDLDTDLFFYLNVQPVAAIRSALRR